MKRQIYVFIFFGVILCSSVEAKIFLVFGGKTGWIGQKIVKLLEEQGNDVIVSQQRLEDRKALMTEIRNAKPDHIINAAGVTGNPNVDWCEDHKQETIRANLIGALNLFDIACLHNVHVINIGTGCIYEYNDKHPMHSNIGFTEEEEPNFQGSFYSFTKIMLDKLIASYPNVLNLRLRMPISDDLHPRNFITKITKYRKVINIPNSMSILSDLLPLIPTMAKLRLTGNYNFVNPGVISHNEILDLYKKYIDPTFVYENFTIEEQNRVLKAGRSNNHLDVSKLLQVFPDIPHIADSIKKVFERMKLLSK